MPASSARLNNVLQAVGNHLAPNIWRADQMGSYRSPTLETGFPCLDQELPGGGWPRSTLIELLLQQHGIGEIRLLRPALAKLAQKRKIALVQPPYMPQVAACQAWGINPDMLLLLTPKRTADCLWTAEQILRNGSCGALLFWQVQIRDEALRRLQLAAQGSETMCWVLRPLTAAENASPSPLRLALRPAAGGVAIHVVKRKGPQHEIPVNLRFNDQVADLASVSGRTVHAPLVNAMSPAVAETGTLMHTFTVYS